MRHYLTFNDFTREEYEYLFERARVLKAKRNAGEAYTPLQNKILTMIFEKQSTRTRMSFEAGMIQLGGSAIYLNTRDSQLGRGEPIEDAARVISRMTDVVMIRTFGQEIIERFVSHSKVPVINGLTDEHHPCQVLADVFTFIEHRGPIQGKTVAWIGDTNNVSNSWLEAANLLDFKLNMSCPPGYTPDKADWHGPHHDVYENPVDAMKNADLVYTDVWTSMGFEAEDTDRKAVFKDWQVNAELMKHANPDALFMHCLPAHRGEEVTSDVIDGPQSVVWDEAENRMHTEKAVLEFLLLGRVA